MEFETFAAQLQILRIWVHNNKCKIPASLSREDFRVKVLF